MRRSSELGCDRVATEEAVQLLHFARGIVRLVERLEPRRFGLDETRERRRDGQLLAGDSNQNREV